MKDCLTIVQGDCRSKLRELETESVQCCVTSPPYWGLRDYGHPEQIGQEPTPERYVESMVAIMREVRRVLKSDGTLWLNLGDSYAGTKLGNTNGTGAGGVSTGKVQQKNGVTDQNFVKRLPPGLKSKDLCLIPARVALALQSDGWWVRSDIIWHKPNPMPESVQGSHFSRHRVTVEEYENLSGLQYAGERAGDEWAGDMPKLSEIEIPMRKAPLSAEQKGYYSSASTRTTGRRKRETASIRGIGARDEKQCQIPADTEGSCEHSKTGCELPSESQQSRGGSDSARLDRDSGASQPPMLLLQKGAGEDDLRPCDTIEQRGQELARECGSGVQVVQQQEARQDVDALLVGCPGCPKCEKYHGYIFHLSAGRCTKSHEYLFLLTKSERYYYDAAAIKEPATELNWESRLTRDSDKSTPTAEVNGIRKRAGVNSRMSVDRDPMHSPERKVRSGNKAKKWGTNETTERTEGAGRVETHRGVPWEGSTRNKRSVWTVGTAPYQGSHFATFPAALITPCILAGTKPGDVVLDPFGGSGTTGEVALSLGRKAILIELNSDYVRLIEQRCETTVGLSL